MDDEKEATKDLNIIIEKRGKLEDKKLDEHFQRLISRGTALISSDRIKKLEPHISFKSKIDDINGLQLADLLAYPIARYVLEPQRANPSFDILRDKIYP